MISRHKFLTAVFLLDIQDLKDAGLVAGGLEFDRQQIETIVRLGKEQGQVDPTDEEIASLVEYFIVGGQFERDFAQ